MRAQNLKTAERKCSNNRGSTGQKSYSFSVIKFLVKLFDRFSMDAYNWHYATETYICESAEGVPQESFLLCFMELFF